MRKPEVSLLWPSPPMDFEKEKEDTRRLRFSLALGFYAGKQKWDENTDSQSYHCIICDCCPWSGPVFYMWFWIWLQRLSHTEARGKIRVYKVIVHDTLAGKSERNTSMNHISGLSCSRCDVTVYALNSRGSSPPAHVTIPLRAGKASPFPPRFPPFSSIFLFKIQTLQKSENYKCKNLFHFLASLS